MQTYPVVLLAGETAQEDDVLFRNWVERARQLPSLDALRASFSEVDVRLERRLLFEYAKVKTKRVAPSSSTRPPGPVRHAPPSYGSLHRGGTTAVRAPDQRLSSAADPVAPRPITRSLARGALSILVIKSVHDVWAVCRRGTSNSHEFSEWGYPRHFTRYWLWPWRRRRFRIHST
jgi:hypothetical protein